uniref:Uncharacterized protein n=1 Tax=Timema tahoe TaxID=61484 RepID=A0A7R9IH10_9NEOP|nr:unnamed protein product [Timema tahoe]
MNVRGRSRLSTYPWPVSMVDRNNTGKVTFVAQFAGVTIVLDWPSDDGEIGVRIPVWCPGNRKGGSDRSPRMTTATRDHVTRRLDAAVRVMPLQLSDTWRQAQAAAERLGYITTFRKPPINTTAAGGLAGNCKGRPWFSRATGGERGINSYVTGTRLLFFILGLTMEKSGSSSSSEFEEELENACPVLVANTVARFSTSSSFSHSASSLLPEVQAACDVPSLNFTRLSLSRKHCSDPPTPLSAKMSKAQNPPPP